MKQLQNKYGTLSLVSIVITGALTSIHHFYEIGFYAVILALLFIVIPFVLMQRFRKTGNKTALWIYGLLNTWLVFGLGLVDGLWNHIIRPLGFQIHSLLSFHSGMKLVEQIGGGTPLYEFTGIATFVASMFAAYYGYKFIKSNRELHGKNLYHN